MLIVHIPSWFPIPEKPLNGNFIFRHIESLGESVKSVIFHHVHDGFNPQIPNNAELFPVTVNNFGKFALFKAYMTAFEQLIQQYGKPDILHLHVALPLGPLAVKISRKYHIPLIISEHWTGYLPINRPKLSLGERLILRHTFRQATHITAVSQNLLDNICISAPTAAKKPQTVVGNVVDTELFSLKNSNLQSDKKPILHVSTIDNDAKNIMGILHAIQQLSLQRSDFELNIVHDFQNTDAEEYVRANHLSNIVHFLGRKTSSEIADLLHHSACFLLFSNYENQPCVLLESFSTGTPAVTTPVGGILEITNDENSLIVPPKDEPQLIEKLNFILNNSTQYLPSVIRENALEICSPEVIGRKWLEVYELTMGNG